MNNAKGENNQLLRYWQKYEFSMLLLKIWPPLKRTELLVNMYARSYSTLVKKMELGITT